MYCIIDTGGGNRGIFGAGVLERCLAEQIHFDCCIGVSAGSANLITFLARQSGRLYRFYHDYAFRKEYMSVRNLLQHGAYIDLDYIYSVITNTTGEDPLDFATASAYPGRFEVVVTRADTAEPEYLLTDAMEQDDYWLLKASCAIPFACKPIRRNGQIYYDGGIGDPIPIDRALELGCDKIVLILSRPNAPRSFSPVDKAGGDLLRRTHPALAEALCRRIDHYNASLQKAQALEREGKCLIVAPNGCCHVGTLKKKPSDIDALYRSGYEQAEKIKAFLRDTSRT